MKKQLGWRRATLKIHLSKRSDAEAARRVAAGTAATGTGETWVAMATARGLRDRPRSPSRPAKGRGKTKDKDRDASPTMGGTLDTMQR